MMSSFACINQSQLRTTKGMKSLTQATLATVVLLAGCNLGETELGTFDDDAAGTSGPVGEQCERGDVRFARALSGEPIGMNHDILRACSAENVWVEADRPQGPASVIHRFLNVELECQGEDALEEITLSLVAPKGEAFPFKIGQELLLEADRTFAPDGWIQTLTIWSASDGEVLFSDIGQSTIVPVEDAPPGTTCEEVWQDRIDILTNWLEPLDAQVRGSSCRDGGLSVQTPDGELGPGQGADAPGGHRVFVEEASCTLGYDGSFEFVLWMGYWRTP